MQSNDLAPYHLEAFKKDPLYVSENLMKADAKLEWLTLELHGEGWGLCDFAVVFMKLFKDSLSSKSEQRRLCLELYRKYAHIEEADIKGEYKSEEEYRRKAYTSGVNIPADEIQGFEKNWDPEAPARCLGCKRALQDGYTKSRCPECIAAAATVYCATCTGKPSSSSDACGSEASMHNGRYVCGRCGYGAAEATMQPPSHEHALGIFKDMNDANNMMANYFNFDMKPISEEATMTKKRKRL